MVNITPNIWDANISFLRNINNTIFINNQHFPPGVIPFYEFSKP